MRHNDAILQLINEFYGENFPAFIGEDSYFQIDGQTNFGTIPNFAFDGTKFGCDYENTSFLHFTKLSSLKAILETQSIRMSSFNSFADNREFIHASEQIFNIPESELFDIKNRLFAFSMTENGGVVVRDNYNYHWSNYGNSDCGVAIEFSINTAPIPHGYYLTRVQYQNELAQEDKIKCLKEKLQKYFPNGCSYKSLLSFLLPFVCSYKQTVSDIGELYEKESEVRLLYFENESVDRHFWHQFNRKDEGKTDFDLDSKSNLPIRYYHSLPLSFPNDSSLSLLKLTRVHFGEKIFNKGDATADIIMNYFRPLCNVKEIEIIY